MGNESGRLRETGVASVLTFEHVTKRFKRTTALSDVSLAVPRGSIVGLVGRNGCGKTTLLHHATGMQLPTEGACHTFDVRTDQLAAPELARIGAVHQHAKLLGWMRIGQLVHYVGTFYDRWDAALAAQLSERLLIESDAKVGSLSPGNVQKVSLVLALSHHPELLLLDEPLSDLDPMARSEVAAILLEYFSAHDCTMVISSHLLHDIEPMINRVVCLEQGRVTADAELDTLKEVYEEWIVSAPGATLPTTWTEPGVVRAFGNASEARLIVRGDVSARRVSMTALAERYQAEVRPRALNLEALFPILTQGDDVRNGAARNGDSKNGAPPESPHTDNGHARR